MNERTPTISSIESEKDVKTWRKAVAMGLAASVLGMGQFMEEGLPINSENPLYQKSKTADTINVAVVDYTDSLDETFVKEAEEVFDQVMNYDENLQRPTIDIDIDVVQPLFLNKMITTRIPPLAEYEGPLADLTTYRDVYDYESVVAVVDKDARSVNLGGTKYSRVVHNKGESQTQAAITLIHELGHQLELGHVWSLAPGSVHTDIMGRKFVDIHDNSSAAGYDSYDEHTGNVMGSTSYGGKNEGGYARGVNEEHPEGEESHEHALSLTGMQLDRLYYGSEGYTPLGETLTPDSANEETEIAVGTHQYVKAHYPGGLEWDEYAIFKMSSGYERIDINSLVLEPTTYEQDGETFVSYRLYLADDSENPQMLYIQRTFDDHAANHDSSQTVSVNGLAFRVEYSAATQRANVRVMQDLNPAGG